MPEPGQAALGRVAIGAVPSQSFLLGAIAGISATSSITAAITGRRAIAAAITATSNVTGPEITGGIDTPSFAQPSSRPLTASLRILPLGGQWETLGSERLPGIVPEAIEASCDSWGPSTLTFTLKAEAGARRPDILPFTPVELEVGGVLVWAGFVWQRPSDANNYSVGCRGWQYHLDDDLLDRMYVHTRLADYRDQRTFLSADLTRFKVNGSVFTDRGLVTLGYDASAIVTALDVAGVTLDLGAANSARRVVMVWESSNNNGGMNCFVRGDDDGNPVAGADYNDYFSFAMNSGASGTNAATIATPRRYVHVFLYCSTNQNPVGANVYLRVTSLQAFRDPAYESGNASILKADTVIKDVLNSAPLLSQATNLISAGTFSLPEYLTGGYVTPRAVMEAVNAVENYRLKVGGPSLRQLVFDPKPSSPIAEIGDWSGAQFDDATVTGEPIYDKAVLDGTGPDGARLTSITTQTGTQVDRRGFHRASRIDVGAAVTSAVATRINQLWLAEHRTAPFAGNCRIVGSGARRVLSGNAIPPHEFLLYAGEKIRMSNRIDPDTGAWGRDGRIAGVTYRHDERSVSIAIDDQRQRFDTILARYAALVGG